MGLLGRRRPAVPGGRWEALSVFLDENVTKTGDVHAEHAPERGAIVTPAVAWGTLGSL